MKKIIKPGLIIVLMYAAFILTACQAPTRPDTTGAVNDNADSNQPTGTAEGAQTGEVPADQEMYLGQNTRTGEGAAQKEDKLCGWIDKSDIIVKVIVPEGIKAETSYEAGFYFSPIYSTMRIARSGCDYRVGFMYSELENKGAAQVGVRGYSDNRRRQLVEDPLSVVFDAEGKPSIGTNIEVTIKD
jgi:hypothetical protein